MAGDDNGDVYRNVIVEVDRRSARSSSIQVIDVTPSPGERPLIGIAGFVSVFVGRKGTGAINELREVLTLTDRAPGDVGRALEGLMAGFNAKAPPAQTIASQPIFANIVYNGEVLNRGIFVPESARLAFAVFPYNGGRISPEGFDLVEYPIEETDAELEALGVLSSPPMTPAETAALSKVSGQENTRSIGPPAWCDSTWWDVAAFVVSATYAMTCTIVLATREPRRLSEEQLAELDPASSPKNSSRCDANIFCRASNCRSYSHQAHARWRF